MPTRKRKSGTRKSKHKGSQRGRGVKDVIGKVIRIAKPIHSFVKSTKLVSRVLRHTGHSRASAVASQLGYGYTNRPMLMSMTGGRRKRKSRTVSRISKGSLLSLPHVRVSVPRVRSRRTRRVIVSAAPSVRKRALYPAGQVGTGFIGKTLGGLAGGFLGGLLPF